jgi:glycosyltransferase involved in cell wall biosynthesis
VRYFRGELSAPLSTFLPFNTCVHYILASLVLGGLAASIRPLFESSRAWLFCGGALFSLGYLFTALPLKNRGERTRSGEHGVLILSQSLTIGGLEKMILHLCKELKAEGRWRVRVLAYDHTDNEGSLLNSFMEAGIPVDCFKKAPGFSIKAVYRILHTIFRNDIHIVHSNDLGTLVYAVIVKVLSFGKVSVVHTQHSFPSSENTPRYRLYRYIASSLIDRLSVVSQNLCEPYSPFLLTRAPIHVIENGVQFANEPILKRERKIDLRYTITSSLAPEQRQALSGLMNDLWIIYLARFYPGKGQDHALALWREMLPAERARSVLCLIGPESAPGEYERIQKIIEQAPDRERVLMIEGSRNPLQWMQAGDLFLSCSQYEGMPLAPLEAAGSGMPLLLSSIPGHFFLSGSSRQFPLEDLAEGSRHMRALLDRILQGGDRYQAELWERSRQIRERFSVAAMAAKYSKLYEINSV